MKSIETSNFPFSEASGQIFLYLAFIICVSIPVSPDLPKTNQGKRRVILDKFWRAQRSTNGKFQSASSVRFLEFVSCLSTPEGVTLYRP